MGSGFSRRDFLHSGLTAGALLALDGCIASRDAGKPGAAGSHADLILNNARIATLDKTQPSATAAAIHGGRFVEVGDERSVMMHRGSATKIIDARGAVVIPGLNDSHLHLIRGGLNYNLELRWDGVPSLADAMRMLKLQVERTPSPQWVRVVGGFCEFQFAERRLPTLDELNQVAPNTPVFILHLYDRALLNGAALRAVGYSKDTPEPPGGLIERDKSGNPTGLLIANPNATILYKTLSLGPKLTPEQQYNSTRHFLREMNRLGLTSCCDAGGGYQSYPEDYQIIQEMDRKGEMTVRIAYNLFTQHPKKEKDDFARWVASNNYREGDDFLRLNGAGEMLVYSAADFEDFRVPRPDMAPEMETELRDVVRILAKAKWPWRLHTTYDETISRALNVFEKVNREVPIGGLRWFLDHCETISDANLERVKALGGGIAIQDRMAFQGEYFAERYGKAKAQRSPPIAKMIAMQIPVGAGTDATRVSSYNPWVSMWWMVSGKTLGGLELYGSDNRLSREAALRLFTSGSAWFSREEEHKGTIKVGQLADFAVLSDDYFTVAEEKIRGIESLLTVVDGKVVYAAGPFKEYDRPALPVLPDWSPVAKFDGAYRAQANATTSRIALASCCPTHAPLGRDALLGGCSCFMF
jgi:predicted amidohydrolase YtcJ